MGRTRAIAAVAVLVTVALVTGIFLFQARQNAGAVQAVLHSEHLQSRLADWDQFPTAPGHRDGWVVLGGPVSQRFPATFTAAVRRVPGALRVTLTEGWGDHTYVLVYEVTDGQVVFVESIGLGPPYFQK